MDSEKIFKIRKIIMNKEKKKTPPGIPDDLEEK
jgi:hypothetical protein